MPVLLALVWPIPPGSAQVATPGGSAARARTAAGPLWAAPADDGDPALVGLPHVPGELLVIFDAAEEDAGLDLLDAIGAAELAYYEHVRLHHVRVPEGWTVSEALVLLAGRPGVAAVSPNDIRFAASDHLTRLNDPEFPRQWYLDNRGRNLVGVPNTTGPVPGIIDADIDAPQGWQHGTDCSGFIVAVMDSGLDVSHPDIVDNLWVSPGEIDGNNIDDDGNGIVDDVHGASFIARERHAERFEQWTDNNANGMLDNADSIYWDADFTGDVSAADVPLAGPARPNNTRLVVFQPVWKHTDNVAANQVFDNGESIYADWDANDRVSAGDILLFGPAVANNTPLVPMMRGRDGRLQPGEPIYLDTDASGDLSLEDRVLSPAAVTRPSHGARFADFTANEQFVDGNNNRRYDTGEPVYRDNNADGRVDAGDTLITGNPANPGTGLVAFGRRSTGDVDDLVGHGTNVAGVLAARGDNNIDIAGVCWRAQLMVLRVANPQGRTTDGAVIAAIDYVTAQRAAGRDIRLVNHSFSGPASAAWCAAP